MTERTRAGSSERVTCSLCAETFWRDASAPWAVENEIMICFDCFSKQFSKGRPISHLVVGFHSENDDRDPLWAIRHEDSGVWTFGTVAGDIISIDSELAHKLVPFGW